MDIGQISTAGSEAVSGRVLFCQSDGCMLQGLQFGQFAVQTGHGFVSASLNAVLLCSSGALCSSWVRQAMLQLAEWGALFGAYDIIKEKGKYASTDAYEDHFELPDARTLMLTNRRVMLLQVCARAPVPKRLSGPQTLSISRVLRTSQYTGAPPEPPSI